MSKIFILILLFSITTESLQNILLDGDPNIEIVLDVTITDGQNAYFPGIRDAAIAPNGQILLIPSRLKKIYLFDANGEYVKSAGREGRGPGEFKSPSRLTVGPQQYTYIYDIQNARISVLDKSLNHVRDINFRGGWNTHFKTNNDGVFIWTEYSGTYTNGNSPIVIYEVLNNPWRIEPFPIFECEDWKISQDFLDIWSRWDMTDDLQVFATGDFDDFSIYHLNKSGEIVNKFGKEYDNVERSEQEREQKIEAASKVSSQAAAMLKGGLPDRKPSFIELSIDNKDRVWVHRNKIYGDPEELDVYSLEGNFIKTVTLPAAESEYRMLEIFDDKILFKVTNPNGSQELKVYRIEG